ncbi:hypothetical protein RND81_08G090100 [Saponaria officinalis]|uniref:Chalcone isomerase domain-containing protein n=1 Tax=Saponaria officinalis TaxID=3572 RepID=A0AAW1J5G9_SAPOF
MKNHWHLLIHPAHDDADPFVLPTLPFLSITFPISSFVLRSQRLLFPAISASRQRFSNLCWFSNVSLFKSSNSNFFTHFKHLCHAVSTFSIKHPFIRPDSIQSLAAAIILPLNNLASNMFSILPAHAHHVQMLGSVDQTPCTARLRGCLGHSFTDHYWTRRAVEPLTGIEFPGILNNIVAMENQSNLSSEVLVGTGSRTVTIIKIKSLKVYAFGFYVHPYSICQKLGSKYANIPAAELKDCSDFYADLLREDIGMTVRLVVNCNGMKINAVKDSFEKSLRARLVKTNPETDFKCIETFGSFFTKDIPLPVGTIIDLRRTSDGQLITEIGGNQIGAVNSRELCRAFFDMYLGEVPVSKQTKEEIGSNVASIVRRC